MYKTKSFNESYLQGMVEKHRNGDKEAFAKLATYIRPYAMRIANQGVDKETAKDIVSDFICNLYAKSLLKYQKEKGAFIVWMGKSVTNLKRNYLKKRKHVTLFNELSKDGRLLSNEEIPHAKLVSREETKSPLKILLDREREQVKSKAMELLPKMIQALSEEEQLAIYCGFYAKMTDKQISLKLMGNECHANKYRMIRCRALSKLAKLFAGEGIKKI